MLHDKTGQKRASDGERLRADIDLGSDLSGDLHSRRFATKYGRWSARVHDT